MSDEHIHAEESDSSSRTRDWRGEQGQHSETTDPRAQHCLWEGRWCGVRCAVLCALVQHREGRRKKGVSFLPPLHKHTKTHQTDYGKLSEGDSVSSHCTTAVPSGMGCASTKGWLCRQGGVRGEQKRDCSGYKPAVQAAHQAWARTWAAGQHALSGCIAE